MSPLDVRIETLPPMRMISAYGFGSEPEGMAANKIVTFLKIMNLLDGYGSIIPHYGFNNPNPSSGSPNYGYEIWVKVPEHIAPAGDVKEIYFEGGLYASTRFTNLFQIGDVWRKLSQWREDSPYLQAEHQWLERLFNPLEKDPEKFDFALYLPIKQ